MFKEHLGKKQRNNYLFAVLYFGLHVIIDVINNIFIKKLGENIPSYEIVFLIFIFSVIILFPFMIYYDNFKTFYMTMHINRGLFLSLGVMARCVCLKYLPIATVVMANFASPMLFLLLAFFFLDEKTGFTKILLSLIGFLGVFIAINPMETEFNSLILLLLSSCLLLTAVDILNKKYVVQESVLSMAFYLCLYTALFSSAPILYFGWVKVSQSDLLLGALLGAGTSLMILLLLKAFTLVEATSLLPLKYLALPIAMLFGYLIFGDIPSNSAYLGVAIVVLSDLIFLFLKLTRFF